MNDIRNEIIDAIAARDFQKLKALKAKEKIILIMQSFETDHETPSEYKVEVWKKGVIIKRRQGIGKYQPEEGESGSVINIHLHSNGIPVFTSEEESIQWDLDHPVNHYKFNSIKNLD